MEQLQQENESLKAKLLRLDITRDDHSRFQFHTNLPNYQVVTDALSVYIEKLCRGNLKGANINKAESTVIKDLAPNFPLEEELLLVLGT